MNGNRWLAEQLPAWVREGLISPQQADALRERHPLTTETTAAASGSWGRVIFAALGAVIFGLGIILAFAYNWEAMHRYTKLACIAIGLAAAHGGGRWLMRAGSPHARLGEALHLLGTMLFGGGIWLVAQIYHIDEHYPNAFLAWSIAALALAWALPSVAHGFLAAVLITAWSWFEIFDFHRQLHGAPWIIAVALIPLAWLERSRALLGVSALAFLVLYAANLARVDDDLILATLWLSCGALLGAAALMRHTAFPDGAAPLRRIGLGGFLILVYVGSFAGAVGSLHRVMPDEVVAWLYFAFPATIFALVWVLALTRGAAWATADDDRRIEIILNLALGTLVILACFGLPLGGLLWVACNIALLGYAAVLIRRGTHEQRGRLVTLGCLIIAAVVFARFMDLFHSLLLRAALFLALGAGLFWVGTHYSRHGEARDA